MRKFVFSLLMCMLIGISVLAGCGSEQEVEQEAAPVKISIYTYDDILDSSMNMLYESHTDWKERVELVVISKDEYDQKLKVALYGEEKPENEEQTGSGEETAPPVYPDIFLADTDELYGYVNAETVISMNELGLTGDDMSQMYQYTKDSVTDKDGNQWAVTWSIDPTAFIYNRAMAVEYLGSDDPRDVQSYIKDEHTKDDTLLAMKKKSGKEYRILDSFSEYRDDRSKTTVFGFYCDMDGLMDEFASDIKLNLNDKWGVCKGTKDEMAAGPWLMVTKDCKDKELALNVIKELCLNESVLKAKQEEKNNFVNNIRIMSNAFNTGKGKLDVLGSNDCMEIYDNRAKKATPINWEDLKPEETQETTDGEQEG